MPQGSELRKNSGYLQGISLFNAGEFYEAHEVWESIWLRFPKASLERIFLGALIQLAASRLKEKQNQPKPSARLQKAAVEKLDHVAIQTPVFAGLNIADIPNSKKLTL